MRHNKRTKKYINKNKKSGSGKTYSIFGTKRSIEYLNKGEISAECGIAFRALH
jgi:hypothetical protein